MKKSYDVLAYYAFTALENPLEEVKAHKDFFKTRDVTCRIYISEQGINGQMSALHADAIDYINWMHAKPPFRDLEFKVHPHHEHAFPKKAVKYRKQLVALDVDVDLSQAGDHLAPSEWKAMLEEEKDKILIDVRNDYEWKVGHFEGAELPKCNTFREFNDYADKLKETVPKDKPVMMYCTGGIRCELYSSLLKAKGFEKVYQLQGGVIKYGLTEGSKHWKGKLFVFDDRLTIPISDEKTEVIGACQFCAVPAENYFNCANMDCNTLFLCCESCLRENIGCCQNSCQHAEKVRPFADINPHKPFRKQRNYFAAPDKCATKS